jgi:hypothetical protein
VLDPLALAAASGGVTMDPMRSSAMARVELQANRLRGDWNDAIDRDDDRHMLDPLEENGHGIALRYLEQKCQSRATSICPFVSVYHKPIGVSIMPLPASGFRLQRMLSSPDVLRDQYGSSLQLRTYGVSFAESLVPHLRNRFACSWITPFVPRGRPIKKPVHSETSRFRLNPAIFIEFK